MMSAPAPWGKIDVREASIEFLQAAQGDLGLTARGLVQAYLARIDTYDKRGPVINSVLRVNPHALQQADELDRERYAIGPRGPLHGIPVLVKDNFETVDMPTSMGSIVFKDFHPCRDGFQVRRLKQAGAIILGKTTMHELAMGVTNASSLSGYTRNPYVLNRVPGGSSGGTGAAVAASFATVGMGSDTAGSIRIPAANQALVGLRPTTGLSSRSGVVPLSHTQDVVAPLARCVEDLAIMLDATVGEDSEDASTQCLNERRASLCYRQRLRDDVIPSLSVGVLRDLFGDEPEDAEVTEIIDHALSMLKHHGAALHPIRLKNLDALIEASNVIRHEFKRDFAIYLSSFRQAPVHSLDEFAALNAHHQEIGQPLSNRLIDSTEADRAAALEARQQLRDLVERTMSKSGFDVLVYPVMRRKACLIGTAQLGVNAQLSAGSGLPAISIPAGLAKDGTPIGMEFLACAFQEQHLLNLAYSWQKIRPIRDRPDF
ncbi:amidase family protein [uncultured Herbaspirillum sp.]|uniref:amidase n=1 Tax=uncultured Herbaspirillum sp. TaxID=160236 RepID=UPI00258B9513|nr:amidase family protein [uncultured Herbaspirillum sp.]